MARFRVTKYNPKYRSASGAYLHSDWTSVSDIGKEFQGEELTVDRYIAVESAYVKAVKVFLELCKIQEFNLIDLEINSPGSYPEILQKEGFAVLQILRDNSIVSGELLEWVIRLALREDCWCRLHAENNSYIHFGYDFYMYVGSDLLDPREFEAKSPDLVFAEPMDSPYLEVDNA